MSRLFTLYYVWNVLENLETFYTEGRLYEIEQIN